MHVNALSLFCSAQHSATCCHVCTAKGSPRQLPTGDASQTSTSRQDVFCHLQRPVQALQTVLKDQVTSDNLLNVIHCIKLAFVFLCAPVNRPDYNTGLLNVSSDSNINYSGVCIALLHSLTLLTLCDMPSDPVI